MAESDPEDIFEDALEDSVMNKGNPPDLYHSIHEASKALEYFLTNRHQKSLDLMNPWADVSLYHALGKGTIHFMQAALTLEAADIEVAMEALKRGAEQAHKKRRRTSLMQKTKILRGPDFNSYTDEEVHAELCYAEQLLLIAILTFVEDQSLVNFVKSGLRIRSCHQAYRECQQMLESREWSSLKHRQQFESGVKMGLGAFNLMMSQLPNKVLKLLEFIGFSGNRALGLKDLEEGYRIKHSVRSPLCALILLSYHTFITYVLGNGEGDFLLSERILSEMMTKYPSGSFLIFFNARIHQLKGHLDKAISIYHESVKAQAEWKQFHYLCYWELLWCYSFKLDWKSAAHYSGVLQKQCKWSPAIYTYVHASMLYMLKEEGNPMLREQIDVLMKKVPGLKQRLAGRSIPLEKFVVRKSQKYFNQDSKLMLPALELQYVWNSYNILVNSPPTVVSNLLQLVKTNMPYFCEESDEPADDYCLGLLLAGMCYKCLGQRNDARDRFRQILRMDKRVKDDIYLLPYAMTEMALIAIEEGNYNMAKDWLDMARHNFHSYPMETMLHFRIHAIQPKLKALSSSSTSTLQPKAEHPEEPRARNKSPLCLKSSSAKTQLTAATTHHNNSHLITS